jgi:hypothetical protein
MVFPARRPYGRTTNGFTEHLPPDNRIHPLEVPESHTPIEVKHVGENVAGCPSFARIPDNSPADFRDLSGSASLGFSSGITEGLLSLLASIAFTSAQLTYREYKSIVCLKQAFDANLDEEVPCQNPKRSDLRQVSRYRSGG